MTLPWLSWILSPFSCIQSFFNKLNMYFFFVSFLPFVAVTFYLDHCLCLCSVLTLGRTGKLFSFDPINWRHFISTMLPPWFDLKPGHLKREA